MKAFLILTAVVYGFLGLSARLSVQFIDMISFDKANAKYLPALIILSFIVGLLFFWWFRNAFPLGYAKQSRIIRTIGLPIAFSCLAFPLNQGWLFTLNTIIQTEEHKSFLTVLNRQIQQSRKSKSYRLIMHDLNKQETFEFKVGEGDYHSINLNDTLEMNVKKGVFNIYYGERMNGN